MKAVGERKTIFDFRKRNCERPANERMVAADESGFRSIGGLLILAHNFADRKESAKVVDVWP